MTAPRFTLLVAAVLASLATSSAEPPGITPIAPYTHGVLLAPGTSLQVDFRVGVPTAQLGAIQTSWASASALMPPQASDATIEVALLGAVADGAMEYASSPDEPYEDSFQVDGLLSGCVDAGGTCWTTWSLTISHTDGSDGAEVHFAFDTLLQGAGGPIAHQIVEF